MMRLHVLTSHKHTRSTSVCIDSLIAIRAVSHTHDMSVLSNVFLSQTLQGAMRDSFKAAELQQLQQQQTAERALGKLEALDAATERSFARVGESLEDITHHATRAHKQVFGLLEHVAGSVHAIQSSFWTYSAVFFYAACVVASLALTTTQSTSAARAPMLLLLGAAFGLEKMIENAFVHPGQ